jgi:hypothetical protein
VHPGADRGRGHLRSRRVLSPGLLAVAVGLASLAVYLATLAPGLTWAHDSADGGELAAAASLLGIPHPPGYPTYVLLAHLFTLLPLGDVATRTNLFSAVCAAATAALLTWSLARAGDEGGWGRLPAAVGAGLALAFSPLLWSQATVTEVHTLNGLFTALLLALALGVGPRLPGGAFWPGLVWGLSLGNHPTALLCFPLAVLGLLRWPRRWGWGIVGLVLGLAVYLYLPLRAAADPPVNWGDPQTPGRFWWVVSGAPYHHFLFSLPAQYLPTRLLAWVGLLTEQFGWLGLGAAALGAAVDFRAHRRRFAALTATVGLCSVFALGYNTSDSYLYLLPALVCLGMWLGMGVAWAVEALTARALGLGRVGVAVVLLLPLASAAWHWPTQDLSHDRSASDFATAVLDAAPANALVLTQEDGHTFALWYSQETQGRRPDVVVVDTGLLGYDWYREALLRRVPGADLDILLAQDIEGAQRATQALERPVCRIGEGIALVCVYPQEAASLLVGRRAASGCRPTVYPVAGASLCVGVCRMRREAASGCRHPTAP